MSPASDSKAPKTHRSADSSRVESVYHAILLQIVRGEAPPGSELKSTQLARALGVSRTPVVQALQRLASDGIITLEVNKRAVVRPGAENWLVEIHELRELLEPRAAYHAARLISAESLAQLGQLAEAARPEASPGWTEAAQEFDFALHLALADNSGSLVLREFIRKCWSYKKLSYEAAGPERPDVLQRAYQEHMSILDSLRARDPDTAEAAVRFHLRSAASLRPARTIV